HVGGLDVAVDDAARVRVRERLEELRGDLDRVPVVELAGAQRLAERPPRHVLVGDVDVARVASERVDALAARMPERRGGPRLALGAGGRLPLPSHHLQRDVEPGALVPREPDVPHPARPERPQRAVAAEDQLLRGDGDDHGLHYETRRTTPLPAIVSGERWTSTTTSSSTSSRTSPRRPKLRPLLESGFRDDPEGRAAASGGPARSPRSC